MSLLWENDHPDANVQDVQMKMKIIMIAGLWRHVQIIMKMFITGPGRHIQGGGGPVWAEGRQWGRCRDGQSSQWFPSSGRRFDCYLACAQILSNRFWKVLTGFTFIGIFELLFVSLQWFKKSKSKVVPHTIKRSTTVHQLISVEIWIKISPLDQVFSWY